MSGSIVANICTIHGVGPWSRTDKPEWIDRGPGFWIKAYAETSIPSH